MSPDLKRQNKLVEVENKYHALFFGNKDGIWLADLYGRIVECNQSFLDFLDYSEEELVGLNILHLTPENWHEFDEQIHRDQLFTLGHTDPHEKEFIKKDESVVPVSVRLWLFYESDVPVGIWGLARDLSDVKKTEEENTKTQQGLERYLKMLEDREIKMIELKKEIRRLRGLLDKVENVPDNEEAKFNNKL